MATITIENVPETFVKKVGTNIKFSDFTIVKKKRITTAKKDHTIRLQKLVDDPNNTSYGPMSVDNFISEMKKW